MNVVFHVAAAIGTAILVTDTQRFKGKETIKYQLQTGILAFSLGIISHGALDYIPHCYPINSKADIIVGLAIISACLWLTNLKYRLIVALSFLGNIFPDLIDHSIEIINKLFSIHLPVHENFFPWHWRNYSGSIYYESCTVSTLNHLLLFTTLAIICWVRRIDFKAIFLGLGNLYKKN